MAKRHTSSSSRSTDQTQVDRRKFLGSVAAGAGAATVLAGLGAGRALAQNASPAGGPPAGGRPAPPPEPTVSQPPPLKEVAGKTAYITASSDGIGLGIARAFSNAGMNVVIGYRNEKRLAEALPLFKKGAPVHAIKHDVTDRDGWVKLLEEIKGKFGKLHVLVNNAGIKTLSPAHSAKPKDWDDAVAVNFTAIYNGVAVCVPHFREHNEGAQIVTTASMSGILPAVTAGIYTATKFGAVGLMEGLRIELESSNIGTSVFCPGGTSTDNLPPGTRPPRLGPDGKPLPNFQSVMMDPLEAGERVLDGIRNNDLYILSHPEFKDGVKERHDALLASFTDEEAPAARVPLEARTRHTGIYPRELAHRSVKRKTYRG
jgi:NAD(P)-dependent dehydrogenase (short-subunit alcohol dehydrogenase family)